jgi:hypothetical protein
MRILIKIINRLYLLIINLPKKIIFNIFTINLEKVICSVIFGNYSTILLNINGNKILSKNSVNLKKFYKKDHLEFFNTNFDSLNFNPLNFIKIIGEKNKKFYDSSNENNLIKKIFKDNKNTNNQNYKFSIDLLKLKSNNAGYDSEINQLTDLLINNKKYKEINNEYFNNNLKVKSVNIEQRYGIEIYKNKFINKVYSRGFHFDKERLDMVRFFISLDDLNEDAGGTDLINYQDTRKIVKRNFFRLNIFNPTRFFNDKIAEEDKSIKIHKYKGNKGCAVFFNPNLIFHRGNIPSKGLTRTILSFTCGF